MDGNVCHLKVKMGVVGVENDEKTELAAKVVERHR